MAPYAMNAEQSTAASFLPFTDGEYIALVCKGNGLFVGMIADGNGPGNNPIEAVKTSPPDNLVLVLGRNPRYQYCADTTEQ